MLKIALAFAVLYLGWGSHYLAIRFALESFPPFLLSGASALLAGTVLYLAARLSGAPAPGMLQWRIAAVGGFLLFFIGMGGVAWGEQTVSSGLAALILATESLWLVWMDWLFFKGPRPSAPVMAALACGLAGMALLSGAPGSQGWAGVLWVFAASFGWALGSLYLRDAKGMSSLFLSAALSMIAGGTMLLVVSAGCGEIAFFNPTFVSKLSMAAFFYVAAVSLALTYSCYLWLLKKVSVLKVSTYAVINPVVAVFLGWYFASEPITPRLIAGGILITASVIWIFLAPRPHSFRTR